MTADEEWSAPVLRWVRRATTRGGKTLSGATRLLLDDLWSRADAPSKRDNSAHVFIYGTWIELERLASDLGCDVRSISRQLAQLRREGLVERGTGPDASGRDRDGIWLANVPACGRFAVDTVVQVKGVHDEAVVDKGVHQRTTKVSSDDGQRCPPAHDKGVQRIKEDPIGPDQLPDHDPGEPAQGALFVPPPEAKRDHVREVFDHLVARISAAKRECGVSPVSAPRTLTPERRRRIMARIRESGGGDLALGVEMCKRVIAVDEAECRAQGPGGPSWNWWTADTPFRNAENFESRLNRWRADGNHRPFGGGKAPPAQRDSDFGTSERHATNDYERRARLIGEA